MRNACAAYAERVGRICGTAVPHNYAPELQRISRTQKVECSSVETSCCCTVLMVCLYTPKRHVTLRFQVTTPSKFTDLRHVRNAAPHNYAEQLCRICGIASSGIWAPPGRAPPGRDLGAGAPPGPSAPSGGSTHRTLKKI